MSVGRSVRLYLVDGSASGIVTAEIMNWTGHVLSAPRTRLEAAFKRQELTRTGVYILYGPYDDGSDLQKVYVGESDEIAKRIYQHNRDDEKGFWERFVAITSKDMNLTKAHVKYLEGRILDLLLSAKKAKVVNKDNPSFDKLPEADISDMESFLDEMELVLPVVGVDFLRRPKLAEVGVGPVSGGPGGPPNIGTSEVEEKGNAVFRLSGERSGIEATAMEIDGEFVLLSGSIGALQERESFNERIKIIRDDAFETGRAKKIDQANFQIVDNIAFSSPSAASVFLFGTSRNGRTDWIEVNSRKTYGQWKDGLISADLAAIDLDIGV